jgi:hypothetical protein
MSKPNIILFCETHHYDIQINIAEEAVLNRIEHNSKWRYSFIEESNKLDNILYSKRKHCPKDEEINLFEDYLSGTTSSNMCSNEAESAKEKFKQNLTPLYFDTEDRKSLGHTSHQCDLIKKLDNIESDSMFYGYFLSLLKNDIQDFQRDEEIVNNLNSLSQQVVNSYTLGWAGAAHCYDFHHYLQQTNSPLLSKILFLNLDSHCAKYYSDEGYYNIFKTYSHYITSQYNSCGLSEKLDNHLLRFSNLVAEDSDDDTQPRLKLSDFYNSPHVQRISLSISGEEGNTLPWKVADLDIFN